MPRRNSRPSANAGRLSVTAEHAACRQKRRFSSQRSAEAAAQLAMLSDMNLTITTYRCPWCHGWHLTRRSNE